MRRYILAFLITVMFGLPAAGQERLAEVQAELAALAESWPVYQTEIDISVGRQPLSELLRNVAAAAGVNISVKGADGIEATCNFSRARITDLLYFLCREYGLDIDVVGNIVSVSPLAPPPVEVKEPNVVYKIATRTLSLDLSGERLADVTRKITGLSGVNFFLSPAVADRGLSGYISDMPFDKAVRAIAAMNGLAAEKNDGDGWSLSVPETDGLPERLSPDGSSPTHGFSQEELSIDSLGLITARIEVGEIRNIIVDLCDRQGLNYFFATPVAGQVGIWVSGADFETLLDVMLSGTDVSYYRDRGIWIFGAGASSGSGGQGDYGGPGGSGASGGQGGSGGMGGGITTVEVVEMAHRSVRDLSKIVPQNLAAGVQIQEFHDLNCVILSGDRRRVSRVETFLRSIDRRVPLVSIDIIIVDATKQRIMDIGVEAGFGAGNDVVSGGTLTGVDVMLNSASINKLINGFNGFGAINLGQVNPGFYLGLQFLEDNGVIDMQSTPRLSTLGGHEATLTSGETRYYKEVANNYFGSQIPVSTESYVWKPVEANLEIKITPFVSEDGQITLDITIDQTEFTSQQQAEMDAPPGTATRSFSSLIRVRNEEMVLLGGIDQNLSEKSNRGLPWISRVPVIRWFFGKSTDKKSEHKLNVFIKPTLIE